MYYKNRRGFRWIFLFSCLLAAWAGDGARGALQPPSQYLLVPIGRIGFDIEAPGVTIEGMEAVLEYASRKSRITHIIFVIDSPGGLVSEAREISSLLEEYSNRFQYISWVVQAKSAACYFVFNSDIVFVEDRAVQGAALHYRASKSGLVEYDAKMNAAGAANLAAVAESNGFSADLARAMVDPSHELFVQKFDSGQIELSGSMPESSPGVLVERIDGPDTVLALTAREAIEIGLGLPAPPGGIDSVATILGDTALESAGRYGKVLLKRAYDDLREAEQVRINTVNDIDSAITEIGFRSSGIESIRMRAIQAAPDRYDYEKVITDDGQIILSPAAQVLWRNRTDAAIASWNDVILNCQDIGSLFRECAVALKRLRRYPVRSTSKQVHEHEISRLTDRLDEIRRHERDLENAIAEARRRIRLLEASRRRVFW